MYHELPDFDNKIPLYFTTRAGGVSLEPFDTLNLAMHTGDSPEHVRHNRALLLDRLNLKTHAVKTLRQVHGSAVLPVSMDTPHTWASDYDELPAADGLITATSGVCLSIFVADCAALFLYDPENKAIALLHAGWRSVRDRIVEKTLMLMKGQFTTRADNCLAFISPSMKSCCFEVRPDSFPMTEHEWQASDIFTIRNDKHYFDLGAAIRQHLVNNGLKPENVRASELCTVCDQRFFSYRREGKTGRMAALLELK